MSETNESRSFFRAVPPLPVPDDDYEPDNLPAWMAPPWAAAPRTVAFSAEIGRSESTVIFLDSGRAYPGGVTLRLSVRVIERGRVARHRLFNLLDRSLGRGNREERFDPAGPRWGLRFSDGSTVTTLDESPWQGVITDAELQGPVMDGVGHSSVYKDEWAQDFWVWPTPPAPSFDIAVQWAARDIEETVTTIDARELAAGSAAAGPLWR